MNECSVCSAIAAAAAAELAVHPVVPSPDADANDARSHADFAAIAAATAAELVDHPNSSVLSLAADLPAPAADDDVRAVMGPDDDRGGIIRAHPADVIVAQMQRIDPDHRITAMCTAWRQSLALQAAASRDRIAAWDQGSAEDAAIVQRHIAEVWRLRRQARIDLNFAAPAEAAPAEAAPAEDAPGDAAPAESAPSGASSASAIDVDDSPAVTIQSQVDAWEKATCVHLSDAGVESRILPVSPAEFSSVARAKRDADDLAHRLEAEQAESIVARHELDTHRLEAEAAEAEVARLELVTSAAAAEQAEAVVSRAELEADGFNCVVCFVANDMQVLACGHECCRNCIRQLVNPVCPLCRRGL